MSESEDNILPLRDLRRSDWALRALFAVLALIALVSQLQPELVEWVGGGAVQSTK